MKLNEDCKTNEMFLYWNIFKRINQYCTWSHLKPQIWYCVLICFLLLKNCPLLGAFVKRAGNTGKPQLGRQQNKMIVKLGEVKICHPLWGTLAWRSEEAVLVARGWVRPLMSWCFGRDLIFLLNAELCLLSFHLWKEWLILGVSWPNNNANRDNKQLENTLLFTKPFSLYSFLTLLSADLPQKSSSDVEERTLEHETHIRILAIKFLPSLISKW